MVPDPYKALGLPHSATSVEIKRAYRDLARKYHPDRHTQATGDEQQRASSLFSTVSSAYAILSDKQRKAHYDHIYKYGGYDDDESKEEMKRPHSYPFGQQQSSSSSWSGQFPSSSSFPSRKRRTAAMGVGYMCTDPFAFLWSQGKIRSTTTVAGIQIPSRMQMAHPSTNRGVLFAFSSGEVRSDPITGNKQYISKTTQYAQGKRQTKTETTTVHPDGRKEVIIDGEDGQDGSSPQRRRYCVPPPPQQQQPPQEFTGQRQGGDENCTEQERDVDSSLGSTTKDEDVAKTESNASTAVPWYMSAWHDIKDKLTMCHNPCTMSTVVA